MAGRGSLRERTKGSFELTVSLGKGPDGKYIKRTKTVHAKNKTHAKELLNEFVYEVDQGSYTDRGNTLFINLVEDWLNNYACTLAERTREGYESIIRLRIMPYFGSMRVENIKKHHIQVFFDSIKGLNVRKDGKKKPLSNSYFNNHHITLSSIFNYAVDRGYMKENPMRHIEKLKVQKKSSNNVYKRQELAQLEIILKNEPLQKKALVALAIGSGARQGEIAALEWKHIDFTRSRITIEQSLSVSTGEPVKVKSTKSDKVREVSIPLTVLKYLQELLDQQQKIKSACDKWCNEWNGEPRQFVFSNFGRPLRTDTISKWWIRFQNRTKELKTVTFHSLRHSSLSLLLTSKNRLPMQLVQQRAGHSDISTTISNYGHLEDDLDRQAAESIEEAIFDIS